MGNVLSADQPVAWIRTLSHSQRTSSTSSKRKLISFHKPFPAQAGKGFFVDQTPLANRLDSIKREAREQRSMPLVKLIFPRRSAKAITYGLGTLSEIER